MENKNIASIVAVAALFIVAGAFIVNMLKNKSSAKSDKVTEEVTVDAKIGSK